MSKIRVIHVFLESCQKCPNAAQNGNIIYCVKERRQICELEDLDRFMKNDKFPSFCKLMEIEETYVEVNSLEQNIE
jgi:Zn-dependent alcohol dehydrogenase